MSLSGGRAFQGFPHPPGARKHHQGRSSGIPARGPAISQDRVVFGPILPSNRCHPEPHAVMRCSRSRAVQSKHHRNPRYGGCHARDENEAIEATLPESSKGLGGMRVLCWSISGAAEESCTSLGYHKRALRAASGVS